MECSITTCGEAGRVEVGGQVGVVLDVEALGAVEPVVN